MFKKYLKILSFRSFQDNRESISEENRSGIELILLFYSVILILNVVGMVISGQNILHNRSIVLELVYMILAVPFFFLFLRRGKHDFTAAIYLFEIPLFLITILHGTVWDPHSLTFTFLFFLLVLPSLILDKPWRIVLMILSMTAVFLIMDGLYKDPQLMTRDFLHTFNACLMSIASSLYTLASRIQNVENEDSLEERADHDSLTGLYNRYGAEKHLAQKQPGLMVYMDLDQFKKVNDECGHAEGDHVLQETADVLRSSFRKDDVLIRMGGDEFAVFAKGIWTRDQIEQKMAEVLKKAELIHWEDHGQEVPVTVSIGCVYSPDGCTDMDELLKKADQEMYQIKRNGKNDFRIVKIDREK